MNIEINEGCAAKRTQLCTPHMSGPRHVFAICVFCGGQFSLGQASSVSGFLSGGMDTRFGSADAVAYDLELVLHT
jgi:hypothetical protein